MDGTGAAGSTGAVSDAGHTHPTDTSRVPVYGMGQNLLDNWYFLNPVNQRGQASYGSSQYGIDRWKTTSASALTVNDGYVVASATGTNQYWQQNIEQSRMIDGAQYTISVLIKAVTGAPYLRFQYDASPWTSFVTKQITGGGLFKETFTWNVDAGYTGLLRAAIKLETGQSASVVAMKLEPGIEQTLAHQENGVWVLNEVPNYQQELSKCQRYYYKIGTFGMYPFDTASAIVTLKFPTTMRSTPAIKVNGVAVGSSVSFKDNVNASYATGTLYMTDGYNSDLVWRIAIAPNTTPFTTGHMYTATSLEASAEL